MFNLQAQVDWVEWAPDCRVAVIDDALVAPESLRQLAARHIQAFSLPSFNAYPGLELPLPEPVESGLLDFLQTHGLATLAPGQTVSQVTVRLSMATLQPEELSPLQQVCHRDRLPQSGSGGRVVACVLYLFDEPSLGGTGFYRSRISEAELRQRLDRWARMSEREYLADRGRLAGYQCDSDEVFELLGVVPPRFNRLICYDGGVLHTSHITHPGLLCRDPARGRLTLNGFLSFLPN